MKQFLQFIGTFVLTLAAVGSAHAITINDHYWGADDNGHGDRIGDTVYEVLNMDVTFTGDFLNVRVNTNFSEAGNPYEFIEFGDLFISTDGWRPYGSAPYASDDASNGEDWEFVFDTSVESLFGGTFGIASSDELMPGFGYIFRNGQEVQRDSGGDALGGSSVDLNNVGTGGYLDYNILLSSLELSGSGDLGLKWGMTCANDTIEGAVRYNVPEPDSIALLGMGLLGLFGVTARRKN